MTDRLQVRRFGCKVFFPCVCCCFFADFGGEGGQSIQRGRKYKQWSVWLGTQFSRCQQVTAVKVKNIISFITSLTNIIDYLV